MKTRGTKPTGQEAPVLASSRRGPGHITKTIETPKQNERESLINTTPRPTKIRGRSQRYRQNPKKGCRL